MWMPHGRTKPKQRLKNLKVGIIQISDTMKNVFFALAFMLIGSFTFANDNSERVISSKSESIEDSHFVNLDGYTFVYGPHTIDIYHDGELVMTITIDDEAGCDADLCYTAIWL